MKRNLRKVKELLQRLKIKVKILILKFKCLNPKKTYNKIRSPIRSPNKLFLNKNYQLFKNPFKTNNLYSNNNK